VADIFLKDKVKVKICKDSRGAVWAKLIFSSVMNPLPVIAGQGYDILKKDLEIWKLVCQAIKEGRATAKAWGIRLAFDPFRLIKRVRSGDLKGIAHRGSIAQDIAKGRPTELGFITGALIRKGRRKGIKTPALDLIFKRAKTRGA
jgi:2-dehydropantoate 2-reductase